MQYRRLGSTGLQVSALGLGTNQLGRVVDEAGAKALIDQAQQLGLNFIDTAESYGAGASEELLGKALAGWRDEFVVTTKTGAGSEPGRQTASGSPSASTRASGVWPPITSTSTTLSANAFRTIRFTAGRSASARVFSLMDRAAPEPSSRSLSPSISLPRRKNSDAWSLMCLPANARLLAQMLPTNCLTTHDVLVTRTESRFGFAEGGPPWRLRGFRGARHDPRLHDRVIAHPQRGRTVAGLADPLPLCRLPFPDLPSAPLAA